MKIMIFGGAGFVASHLVDLCLEKGDEVIITCRWNEDLSRMKHFEDKVKIEYVEATDITGMIRAINKHRPEVLSWLIAQSWVPYSFDNPIYTMETNAIGTLNLLEAVRIIQSVEQKKHLSIKGPVQKYEHYNPLIHICSSSEFYGKVPKEEQPITEDHPASPMNPYGVGKVGADLMSQLYEKYYDMRILITRMFTHTGLRRTMMSAECFYAQKIATFEKMYVELKDLNGPSWEVDKESLRFTMPLGNMESIRTWRDVRDAVTDYHKLFKANKTGIYNISGDTTKSIQEVLDYLLSISKFDKTKIKFETDPSLLRKIDVDCQYADISKFQKEIDQTKNYTFEQTMEDLLNWWRQNV